MALAEPELSTRRLAWLSIGRQGYFMSESSVFRELLQRKKAQHLPVAVEPFSDLEVMFEMGEQVRPIGHDVVDVAARLPVEGQEVAEDGRGDGGRWSAITFEHGISGDRRPMDDGGSSAGLAAGPSPGSQPGTVRSGGTAPSGCKNARRLRRTGRDLQMCRLYRFQSAWACLPGSPSGFGPSSRPNVPSAPDVHH